MKTTHHGATGEALSIVKSRLMNLEDPITDARNMARVTARLVEDRLDGFHDIPGYGRGMFLSDKMADLLTWAVYETENRLNDAYQAWDAANSEAFDQ